MEQKQEAELVFRRVRVIDEAGVVSWVEFKANVELMRCLSAEQCS